MKCKLRCRCSPHKIVLHQVSSYHSAARYFNSTDNNHPKNNEQVKYKINENRFTFTCETDNF